MKPIHIMRWAPADYVNDPSVKLALAQRDFVSATFYPLFLFHAFIQGGELPAEPTALGAILGMRAVDVRRALAYWTEQGKLKGRDGRLYHERVVRDIADEMAFREEQREKGKLGGRPRLAKAGPLPVQNPVVVGRQSPPSPSPTPTPEPFASAVPSATPAPGNGPSAAVAPAPAAAWSREACDDWQTHLGTPPGGRVGAALKPLVTAHGWELVRPIWRTACEQAALEPDPSYFTPEVFARTFKARLASPRSGPRGSKATVQDRTAANLREWLSTKEGS